jgi:hypothetical protein
LITRDHVVGFVVGLAAAGVGFYMYRKHQTKVDAFLAGKGINLPGAAPAQGESLEDLVTQKERLEDRIAEQEAARVGK